MWRRPKQDGAAQQRRRQLIQSGLSRLWRLLRAFGRVCRACRACCACCGSCLAQLPSQQVLHHPLTHARHTARQGRPCRRLLALPLPCRGRLRCWCVAAAGGLLRPAARAVHGRLAHPPLHFEHDAAAADARCHCATWRQHNAADRIVQKVCAVARRGRRRRGLARLLRLFASLPLAALPPAALCRVQRRKLLLLRLPLLLCLLLLLLRLPLLLRLLLPLSRLPRSLLPGPGRRAAARAGI